MADQQPIFLPFDPDGELTIYFRNLPHWRQPGATYFVTARQADSIPVGVLAQWEDEKARWLRAKSINPTWSDTDPSRFIKAYRKIPIGVRQSFERDQTRLLRHELNQCHGSCLLQYPMPQKLVLDSLYHWNVDRMWLGDVVIMPNHLHAIVQPVDDWQLQEVFGSIKRWTATRIRRWLKTQPESLRELAHAYAGLWQTEVCDHLIRDADELAIYRRYIAQNPEVANLQPGQYVYQAAEWLDAFAERPPAPFSTPI